MEFNPEKLINDWHSRFQTKCVHSFLCMVPFHYDLPSQKYCELRCSWRLAVVICTFIDSRSFFLLNTFKLHDHPILPSGQLFNKQNCVYTAYCIWNRILGDNDPQSADLVLCLKLGLLEKVPTHTYGCWRLETRLQWHRLHAGGLRLNCWYFILK